MDTAAVQIIRFLHIGQTADIVIKQLLQPDVTVF